MRERVEDLGRISVLVGEVLEEEVFSIYSGRMKDFDQWWGSLREEVRNAYARGLILGVQGMYHKLEIISQIADGVEDVEASPSFW